MKNKFLLLICVAFLCMLGAMLYQAKLNRKLRKKLAISESNVVQLMKPDTTEKANVIILTSKQYKEITSKTDELLKENNILKKDVKELHSIKYGIKSVKTAKTDTVWNEDKGIYLTVPSHLDSIDKGIFYHVERPDYKLTWYFDHGCFQNIVTFDPSINQSKDSLVGDVNIDIVVNFIRPKAWFWRLKWNKAKWESETNVLNNCNELKIKENTVIEVR